MGFFRKTVYKKMFLKEDVDEILFYYERQNKEKLKEKYETINPQFYQDIFNELVQQIPIEDALKLLNFKALQKNREELNLSWEYTEEKRKEIYNELKETVVIEKPSPIEEEVKKQTKIEVKKIAKKQEVKRFRFVQNNTEKKSTAPIEQTTNEQTIIENTPIQAQTTKPIEQEIPQQQTVEEEGVFVGSFVEPMEEEGTFVGAFIEPMDIQPVPQDNPQFIEEENLTIQPISEPEKPQAEVVQLTKKKDPTEALGNLLFGK